MGIPGGISFSCNLSIPSPTINRDIPRGGVMSNWRCVFTLELPRALSATGRVFAVASNYGSVKGRGAQRRLLSSVFFLLSAVKECIVAGPRELQQPEWVSVLRL